MSNQETTAAATDVGEFITDLDGGMFDRKLSIALSQVASATVDHDKAGEVSIKLAFKKIPGTSQVHVTHTMKFSKPTMDGKAGEEESRSTFESVSATSTQPLPTNIYFKCQPYADLSERNFVLRLGVLTASDKPSIVLRIVKKEEHDEEMAQELAIKVRQAIAGDGDEIAVVIGSYTAGR